VVAMVDRLIIKMLGGVDSVQMWGVGIWGWSKARLDWFCETLGPRFCPGYFIRWVGGSTGAGNRAAWPRMLVCHGGPYACMGSQ
jgi:hypothetical protein